MGRKKKNPALSTRIGNLLDNRNFLQVVGAASIVFNLVLLILLSASFADYRELDLQLNGGVEGKEFNTYRDDSLGVKFEYPAGWMINTDISTDSQYEDPDIPIGRIPDLSQLDVIVSDGNTELRFVHFFGDLPENVSQFATANRKYEVVEGTLVRYQSTDLDKWFYVDIVDCELNNIILDEALGISLCTGDYFSGFVPGASRVVLSGRTDREILDLMDRVVLSALN